MYYLISIKIGSPLVVELKSLTKTRLENYRDNNKPSYLGYHFIPIKTSEEIKKLSESVEDFKLILNKL